MTSLGKYELHEQLGKGGFGTVYRATDTTLRVDRALKVLHPQLMVDETFIERFRKEALALASLDNHHIVAIHEIIEVEGRIIFAMRYLPGGNLKQLIAKNGPLSLEKVSSILLQVMDGLKEAHDHNYIHRDLKPENILLDSHGEAVITDLGLVREVTGSLSISSGSILGTPNYIAPEIWEGQPATQASDIYSLGCVLYELLTGEVLFEGDTPAYVMKKHVIEGPLISQTLPATTSALLEKALAKNPLERYQTVDEFAEALTGLKQPHQADKPFPWAKVLPIAAGGAVLVMLVVALASGWFTPPPAVVPTETNIPPTVTQPPPTATPMPPTPTAELAAGATQVSEIDDMVMIYVPAGEFEMGSPIGVGDADEHPQHSVYLDAYWIDQTEVTNAMFAQFVAETNHRTEAEYVGKSFALVGTEWLAVSGADWQHPFGPSSNIDGLEDHPVIHVSWDDAKAYCEWAGKRLPTEAEWEKAARGTDGATYPWGNTPPTGKLMNYADANTSFNWSVSAVDDGYKYTSPVGIYTDGASPYGALDMAGNVWEWVEDWYSNDYYDQSPARNPKGPVSGTDRVNRGGAWDDLIDGIRSAYRAAYPQANSNGDKGFRCAKSASQDL